MFGLVRRLLAGTDWWGHGPRLTAVRAAPTIRRRATSQELARTVLAMPGNVGRRFDTATAKPHHL